MGRARKAIITALALGTMAVLVGGAAVGAADYPPSDPAPTQGHLTLPSSVAANGMVDYSGTGCGATQPVSVSFNGTPMPGTTSDSGGAVSGSFAVPASTDAGTYTVSVSNAFCSLSGTVTVLGETAGTLPHTGSSNTIPIVLAALAAVALGSMLVIAARRRRRLMHTTH